MRKLLMLCGAILALSLTAAAQDSTESLAASGPAADPAAPRPSSSVDEFNKQIGVSYQFIDYRSVDSLNYHNNGANFDFTWYKNDWLGLEGNVGTGFGWAPDNALKESIWARTLFAGGGVRIGYRRNTRVEPWGHALVGLQYYHFAQTSATLGKNPGFGYELGGGIDYKLAPRLYLRAGADFLGSHAINSNQFNFQILGGAAFNF